MTVLPVPRPRISPADVRKKRRETAEINLEFYECIKENVNQRPIIGEDIYANGCYDNPKRIKLWLRERLKFLDSLLEYNK